jgi:hypothetical protein
MKSLVGSAKKLKWKLKNQYQGVLGLKVAATNNEKAMNVRKLSSTRYREQAPKYSLINSKVARDLNELRFFGFVAQGPGLQYMAM